MDLISLAEKNRANVDELDSYIEAHIHEPLNLEEDVEAIVLDPSYRETEIETAACTLGCPIEWHSGFRMDASSIPDSASYRGQKAANLAASLLENDTLTPRQIGLARKAGKADQKSLKRVWHCVARFGNPLIR